MRSQHSHRPNKVSQDVLAFVYPRQAEGGVVNTMQNKDEPTPASLLNKDLHKTEAGEEDALITISKQYRIVACNRAAEALFGYQQAEMLGKDFRLLLSLPPKTKPRLAFFGYKSTCEELKAAPLTLQGLHANGNEFSFDATVSTLSAKEVQLSLLMRQSDVGCLSTKLDKELKLELLHQLERLQQFEYLASHNLRGPIATILGLTQLLDLKESADVLQHQQIIQYLKQTALQLDDVVREMQKLLDQQHRADFVKEEVLLSEVVALVAEVLNDSIVATKSTICCDFPQELTIFGTKASLYNVLFQIVSNSIKYRNPCISPIISLGASIKGGCLHLSITDNGLGLDLEKYGHKLFSPYSRFHTHTEGKGLGLHLARTLLWRMGGDIRLESAPNKGTNCFISLPLQ